jgi:hypothetical protein
MLRLPLASHDIPSRPSDMMAFVGYVVAWFARYSPGGDSTSTGR